MQRSRRRECSERDAGLVGVRQTGLQRWTGSMEGALKSAKCLHDAVGRKRSNGWEGGCFVLTTNVW